MEHSKIEGVSTFMKVRWIKMNYSYAIVSWWSIDRDDLASLKVVPFDDLDTAKETLRIMYNAYYDMHNGDDEFVNEDSYLHLFIQGWHFVK